MIDKAVSVSWSNISFWPPFTKPGEIPVEVLFVKMIGRVLYLLYEPQLELKSVLSEI